MEKRIVLAAITLISGCGTDLFPGRLDVSPALRSACPTLTDEEINSGLSLFEAARLDGNTYSDVIGAIVGGDCTSECGVCEIAIADQVYGM
jgi:hypothetical protein